MRAQLDPRSDWVRCTSSAEAPVMLLVLKSEHVQARNYSVLEQEMLLQDCVDEVSLEIASLLKYLLTKFYRLSQTASSSPASRPCL
jgi:hypothetical protein